jgi:hypothetical protein
MVERRIVLELLVLDRQLDAIAELLQLGDAQLLHLVRHVARLGARAERPPLDGVGEDHRRLTAVRDRGLVGGVHLAVVVTAAPEAAQLIVAHILDHPEQSRIAAEEVLANVRAGLDRVALPLAVDGLVHCLDERAVEVLCEQRIPVARPDHLDHVPAGAGVDRLQLLDDLAVAAHRSVEPLQVAVDDERQVVERLAARERQRARGLRLVHLAVAEERPHAAVRRVLDAARGEVAVEARLVHRVHRAEPHRHGGELPELGHQPRVRIRRQSLAAHDLAAEVVELRFGQSALRGTRARRYPAPRGPGRTPGRPSRRPNPCRGRSD